MPKVKIIETSQLSAEDAFDKVANMIEDDPDLKKLDPSYTCDFDKAALKGKATGKLFKADMEIKANSGGSEVTIEVNLPLHLAIAKGMVEKTLKGKLQKVIT